MHQITYKIHSHIWDMLNLCNTQNLPIRDTTLVINVGQLCLFHLRTNTASGQVS